MTQTIYPQPDAQIAARRKELAPGIHHASQEFSRQVFAEGPLDEKTKQLIAVAVAHVTQCPYCTGGHTKAALRNGADERSSWRPYGSPRRCAPAAHTRTRPSRSTASHVHALRAA
jgi:AhpD family alkylhydroperoxidase